MFCCVYLSGSESNGFIFHLNRYPVLFAVDGFQALYHKTKYRDPHFTPINSYHLSIPRLIMEYASGKRSFVRLPTQSHLKT